MSTIAEWLASLGMSEYADRFAKNDIDITVLPELTDQHLKDLGVSLGHRLRILRAIRERGGTTVNSRLVGHRGGQNHRPSARPGRVD